MIPERERWHDWDDGFCSQIIDILRKHPYPDGFVKNLIKRNILGNDFVIAALIEDGWIKKEVEND